MMLNTSRVRASTSVQRGLSGMQWQTAWPGQWRDPEPCGAVSFWTTGHGARADGCGSAFRQRQRFRLAVSLVRIDYQEVWSVDQVFYRLL